MIRDPSDGSVRETTGGEAEKRPVISQKPPVTASGLPMESQRAANQEKLARSRAWLEEYHASRNPEKTVRLMGEQGGENV